MQLDRPLLQIRFDHLAADPRGFRGFRFGFFRFFHTHLHSGTSTHFRFLLLGFFFFGFVFHGGVEHDLNALLAAGIPLTWILYFRSKSLI